MRDVITTGNVPIVYGVEEGDMCLRPEATDNPVVNYCSGIIEEGHHGDGCSCHISPPCSYCTSSYFYCPNCGWNSEDEELKEEQLQ